MNLFRWARTQWDRVGGWILVGVGALAIVIGWNGVAGNAFTALQVPYIVSGGIGGLFMLGIGATLLLSADLKDEWRKLDTLEQAVRAWEGHDDEPASVADEIPTTEIGARVARKVPARRARTSSSS